MSRASGNTYDTRPPFRPFTRESLLKIQNRISEEYAKKKELEKKKKKQVRYDEENKDEGPRPNSNLEQGMPLPIRLAAAFVPELACALLEDIDTFYQNQATFMIISKKKNIFRFSATDAVWLLSPFNPIRRVAIAILTHGLFTLVIITTILTNCFVMIMPPSPITESTEVIFTAIYTVESCVKVMARGFILEKFTYLRDPWNWLDFVVISLAYITMGIDLGNLAVLRTFRVLRVFKAVAMFPGLKTVVEAIIESVKNLRDVIILTIFSLSVFALVGLQIYMGVLTQKCIKDLPWDPNWDLYEYNERLNIHYSDSANWFYDNISQEYKLCGNFSGAGCEPNYTCKAGYGDNPDHDYTSFDTFGLALLSAFRLMTQDYWERLYQQILLASGPWQVFFFIVIIFFGSFYLVNLILAIVAMSYDELQKKSKAEDLANAAELENMRMEEVAAQQKAADDAAEFHRQDGGGDTLKTPSEYSCRNYEGWEGGEAYDAVENKELKSMQSEVSLPHDQNGRNLLKKRKASMSLPGSPFTACRGSKGSHKNYKQGCKGGDKKPLFLSTYMDAQEHLRYADELSMGSRHSSCNSYATRLSYTSHGDLMGTNFGLGLGVLVTKESESRMRSKTMLYDIEKATHMYDTGSDEDIQMHKSMGDHYYADGPMPSCGGLGLKDVLVLYEIIDLAGGLVSKAIDRVDEEEGNQWKHKVVKGCFQCIDIFCVWDWGFPWSALQKCSSFIVFDPFAELFITLAIGINTLFMAMDYHGLKNNPTMNDTLKIGNKVFATIFAIEATMKLIAMSPKYYFQKDWNIFDFIIVTLSLLEMVFEDANFPGISALRSFRLLRVFKLAKSWPTLNLVIHIMGKTMGALGNLVFVLIIIIFMFAVMGMQLFSKDYFDKYHLFKYGEMPRWNFTDFWHSFMIIFRVLCGEWIESMWDCVLVSGPICIPFFLATVLIGNFVVLNLFLALLLNSFGTSNLSSPKTDTETNKLTEAFNRIGRFSRWIKNLVRKCVQFIYKPISCERTEIGVHVGGPEEIQVKLTPQHSTRVPEEIFAEAKTKSPFHTYSVAIGIPVHYIGVGWANLRLKAFKLTENKYFEMTVIVLILLSSLALALEDVHLQNNPILQDGLYYMDRIFTVIFALEMIIKWLALGFANYFTNAWCRLDFFIVILSLINFVVGLMGFWGIQAFKTMRTLRALRLLTAMSRMQAMRFVVNALVNTIPSIFNVLLVCLIFWLIFAILGVQLFNGKYYKCIDESQAVPNKIPDYRLIPGKKECMEANYTWINSPMNFDHVGMAYLSLFQVAIFKGWIPIMNDAIDSRQEDQQPHREENFAMYVYFVIFIIFGSFFTLNLFVGVIIDNCNEQKKKAGGSLEMYMTDDQKKYYNAMKKMGSKKPKKAIPRPKWKPQAIVFEMVTNTKFDMFVMLFIGLNTLAMTMDHYQQAVVTPHWYKFCDYLIWEDALNYLNSFFIVVFSSECGLKIFALRYHYFLEHWNLFDFFVAIVSIFSLPLTDLIQMYALSPTWLRVVRLTRVGRVLRLVKRAKGIRTLLFALAMSLPALFNVCLFLFLIMFIFAIFGMSFFMNVELTGGLTEFFNFRTFGQSMILLFQKSTSADWVGVLDGISNDDECKPSDNEYGQAGTCGNPTVGIAFLLSYQLITFLIVINMFVAVMLENYSKAKEEVQEGLTDDDYDMYYEIWAQFDPERTTYIRYDQLSDFLDILDPPLQIHKPNKFKIITMDIPICEDDMMHCQDILEALTKDFFARKGNAVAEPLDMSEEKKLNRPGYLMVSTTLRRQREDYCARLIQFAWRNYKLHRTVSEYGVSSNEIHDKLI